MLQFSSTFLSNTVMVILPQWRSRELFHHVNQAFISPFVFIHNSSMNPRDKRRMEARYSFHAHDKTEHQLAFEVICFVEYSNITKKNQFHRFLFFSSPLLLSPFSEFFLLYSNLNLCCRRLLLLLLLRLRCI